MKTSEELSREDYQKAIIYMIGKIGNSAALKRIFTFVHYIFVH